MHPSVAPSSESSSLRVFQVIVGDTFNLEDSVEGATNYLEPEGVSYYSFMYNCLIKCSKAPIL